MKALGLIVVIVLLTIIAINTLHQPEWREPSWTTCHVQYPSRQCLTDTEILSQIERNTQP